MQDAQDSDDVEFAFQEHPKIADTQAPNGWIYPGELDEISLTGLGKAEDGSIDPAGGSLVKGA